MSRYKLFPRRAASTSGRLLLLCSLSFALLAITAIDGFGQTPSGRPVARLITATGEAESPMQTNHRMMARPAPAAASSALVVASSLERRAFDLINSERAQNGLPSLVWDAELCRMARLHSEKMARLNFFDHEGPDGDLPNRARESGIRWRSLAENIALNQGYDDPVTLAVDQWMHSSGHRANILRGIFTHSAVGIARAADGRVYLTQVFIMR
jgi:uncharacterized protein YkwD